MHDNPADCQYRIAPNLSPIASVAAGWLFGLTTAALFVIPLTFWAVIPAILLYWFAINVDGERRVILGLRRFYDQDVDEALYYVSACASYFGRVVWLAESLARPDVLHDARAKPRAALPQSLKALLVSDTVVVIGLVVLYGSQPSTLFVGAVICASSYIQVVSWAQGQLPGLLALLGTLGVVAFTMRVVSSLTWLLVGLLLVEFLFAFGVFYSLFYVLWREGASGTEGLFWRLVRKLDVRGMLLTEADIQTLIVELSPRNVLNRSLVRNAPAVAHEFSVADGLWTKAVDSVMERAYVVLCDLTDITEGGSLEWEIKQCLKRGLPIVFTVRSSDLDRARLALVRLGTAEGTPMFQWMPRSLADRSLSQWRKDDIFHIVSYLAFLFGVEQSTRSTTMASP